MRRSLRWKGYFLAGRRERGEYKDPVKLSTELENKERGTMVEARREGRKRQSSQGARKDSQPRLRLGKVGDDSPNKGLDDSACEEDNGGGVGGGLGEEERDSREEGGGGGLGF